MADPRFFAAAGPFTLRELAVLAAAELRPSGAADRRFSDVAPIEAAGPGAVTFLDNLRYAGKLSVSAAGACVLNPAMAERAPQGMALLVTPRPYIGFARIAQAFYPEERLDPGLHPTAFVDATARLGPGVAIGANAVVGPEVELGGGVAIGAGAVLGRAVQIGQGTRVGEGASLSHCLVGERVLIHPGVRIGQRGFGFAMDPGGHVRIPQLGRVIIEDDVEIGANTTIDRGSGPDTVIGRGTVIDNLVQIGHNVRIGRGCVIVAQVGIAGSTELGELVAVGGQAGIAGHLRIGAGAQIAAGSGVIRDVPAGARMAGAPALPAIEFWRSIARLRRLAKRSEET